MTASGATVRTASVTRAAADADVASFDEFWDSQAKDEFGDLGPAEVSRPSGARPGGAAARRRPRRPTPPAPVLIMRRARRGVLNLARSTAKAPASMTGAMVDDASGIRRTRLESGLRVVTERLPASRSVAVGFWVGTGSRDETRRTGRGEPLPRAPVVQGHRHAPTRVEIAEAVESVGGDMNAATGQELTQFYVRVPDRHLPLALEILSDIVWSPALARRRGRVGTSGDPRRDPDARRHARRSRPRSVRRRAVPEPPARARDRGHAGDDPRDARATRSPSTTACTTTPTNVVVAVAGNLEHDDVVKLVEAALPAADGVTSARRASTRPTPASRRAGRACSSARSSRRTSCSACARFARDDPDRYALAVVDQVLGGGMSSRLFQEVREQRGLAYSVFSYRSAFEETGSLAVYCGTVARAGRRGARRRQRRARPAGRRRWVTRAASSSVRRAT